MAADPQQLEALRNAYVRDAIDIETFERFVGLVVAGTPVVLPGECRTILRLSAPYQTIATPPFTPWADDQLAAALR